MKIRSEVLVFILVLARVLPGSHAMSSHSIAFPLFLLVNQGKRRKSARWKMEAMLSSTRFLRPAWRSLEWQNPQTWQTGPLGSVSSATNMNAESISIHRDTPMWETPLPFHRVLVQGLDPHLVVERPRMWLGNAWQIDRLT